MKKTLKGWGISFLYAIFNFIITALGIVAHIDYATQYETLRFYRIIGTIFLLIGFLGAFITSLVVVLKVYKTFNGKKKFIAGMVSLFISVSPNIYLCAMVIL